MAPGQISQQIFVRGLPSGVKLLITDVTFKVPGGDWVPSFHSIGKNTSDEEKKKVLPLEITKDGMIGTAYLVSTSVFDTGEGPEVYLHFKLQGTVSIDGHNMDLSGAKGFITVSSTEWGVSRPDYCNVTYQIMGQPPRNIANPLPVLQSPKDVSFIFAANPKDNQVGVNASIDPDAIKDMIGYALQGIFFAHKKAAGWVVGGL